MKYLGWFLAGFGTILSFQTFFVQHYGGDWTLLVRVGSGKPHERIEQELGPVASVDDQGHDGQINYLIARDPFDCHETHEAVGPSSNPPYRYRRILYPLLAGGFGSFSPWTAFWGLVLWLAAGGGLIAAASAYLCQEWKLPGMALAFVLLSPGTYLSAQVLTNDVLATGLPYSALFSACAERMRRRPFCLLPQSWFERPPCCSPCAWPSRSTGSAAYAARCSWPSVPFFRFCAGPSGSKQQFREGMVSRTSICLSSASLNRWRTGTRRRTSSLAWRPWR